MAPRPGLGVNGANLAVSVPRHRLWYRTTRRDEEATNDQGSEESQPGKARVAEKVEQALDRLHREQETTD